MALDKAHRERPPHVLAAIRSGDVATLSAMGRKGGKICGAKRKAMKSVAAAKAVSEAESAQAREVAHFALLDAIEAEYHKQVRERDARAHAMRNLAGTTHD